MVWNRRTDGRFHRISAGRAVDRNNIYGARLVPNSTHDWIIVRDAHPAVISRRLFERARARREGHLSSTQQRGHSPNHGKTWNGTRSRFILSGLMKCALCGSRYQGLTRAKGKKRSDGTRVKNYHYACGGYITKGRAVCQPHVVLEAAVIEAVLDFCRPYMGRGSTKKLTELVRTQIGGEVKEVAAARRRAHKKRNEIQKTIDKLLDNITATNREFVNQRLAKLKEQKHEIECRLDELERLAASRGQIKNVASDARQFLSSLEGTLHEGLPHEKLLALRQCLQSAVIDRPGGTVKLNAQEVLTADGQTRDLRISDPPAQA
jgi:hypothetical protein